MSLSQGNTTPQLVVPFLQNANTQKYDVRDMPSFMRDAIDETAAVLLGLTKHRLIITGGLQTGKTFIIEQLAHNIQHYLKQSRLNKMIFLKIGDSLMSEMETAIDFVQYVENVAKQNKCLVEELCFVTSSTSVATYINSVTPRVRIIVEMNLDDYIDEQSEPLSATAKLWNSWEVITSNSLVGTYYEVKKVLQDTIVKDLNKAYKFHIDDETLTKFLEMIWLLYSETPKDNPENEDLTLNNIHIPVGDLAFVLSTVVARRSFVSSPELRGTKNKEGFVKVLEQSLLEYHDKLESYQQNIINVNELDLPQSIMDVLFNSDSEDLVFITPQGVATHSTEKEKQEKKNFEFKDSLHLMERLQENIIGQDEALQQVTDSLLIPSAGLHDSNKPLRSFFLLGPTGVGKTQLALNLAKEVSTEELPVVRIDMSEYQQEHETAKLFGSPPGYVGYEKGGVLTGAVSKTPRCIVLLDEVEKAHPKVWDAFLQVLDSGQMTDSHGKTVDFTQTIVIMTSNVGVQKSQQSKAGFSITKNENNMMNDDEQKRVLMKELNQTFRPEFLNRLDNIVLFKPLTIDAAREIVKREISIIQERLKCKNVTMTGLTKIIIDTILCKANVNKYGAREVQRYVYKLISQPAAVHIVKNPDVTKLELDLDDSNDICIKSKNN